MKAASRRGSMFIAAILAAALLHPATASESPARQPREPVAFSFRFSRAELDTQRGTERVYQALVNRAARACTVQGGGSGLRDRDGQCMADLVEKVVRRIGAEILTSHWQRSQPALSAGLPASVQQPVALR
jgi:UrcA family protein